MDRDFVNHKFGHDVPIDRSKEPSMEKKYCVVGNCTVHQRPPVQEETVELPEVPEDRSEDMTEAGETPEETPEEKPTAENRAEPAPKPRTRRG